MTGEKKYQIFVSSTYKDLREARQRVMFALLEMNCIPAGMELFPAADESQWKIIRRVIDECDYYLLILGGRYGSVVPDSVVPNAGGMSYTEMEYRYALGRGIPILRFPHGDPKSLLVGDEERKGEEGKWGKLEAFRAFVHDGGTVKHWSTPDELYGKVSSTLAPLLAKSGRPGWVRGDESAMRKAQATLLAEAKKIVEGEGKKKITVHYTGGLGLSGSVKLAWNEMFRHVASPDMMDGISESGVKALINDLVKGRAEESLSLSLSHFSVEDDDFKTIMVKLCGFDWVIRVVWDTEWEESVTHWQLTPLGEQAMRCVHEIPRKRKRGKWENVPF